MMQISRQDFLKKKKSVRSLHTFLNVNSDRWIGHQVVCISNFSIDFPSYQCIDQNNRFELVDKLDNEIYPVIPLPNHSFMKGRNASGPPRKVNWVGKQMRQKERSLFRLLVVSCDIPVLLEMNSLLSFATIHGKEFLLGSSKVFLSIQSLISRKKVWGKTHHPL